MTRDDSDSGSRGSSSHRGIFERPKGSGVWYVRYKDEHGRLHKERVGPKGLAAKVYRKRKTQIAERRFFPEAQKPWDPPFADRIADYLARKRSTLADPSTAERYGRYFREAPETRGKTMRELVTQDFERYRERRRKAGAVAARRKRGAASLATVNKELSFARAVFYDFIEAMEDKGLAPIPNPVRTRLFAPEAPGRTRYLKEDEERRLRAALPDAADWSKVLFAIHTGLDRGEEFALRWSAVDLTTRVISAERRKGRRKGTIPVRVPINDELLEVLRALPSRLTSEWVFPRADSNGPDNGREFDRLVFRPALRRAGIRDFRWKDLRHTFASRLRMEGVEIQTIRDLMGHTTTRMTERYSHLAPSHLHAAVQTLVRAASKPESTHAGDPVGDPSPHARAAARGGDRVSSRSTSDERSVPGGIRTHVTGVKGRCPRPD